MPGVAVVALLQRDRAAAQQVLAPHAVGQPGRQLPEGAQDARRQLLERGQRQRLAVDVVAAEQLVGALAGEHHLDVLAGLAGDEVQRHEGRVGDRVVEVPDDQRDLVGELLRRDDLGDVLDADRRRGLGGHVDLGEALSLEAGGEGQQLRVVPLGQGGDGRGVDAAGEERADGDVGPHVHAHRVVEDVGDPVVQGLLLVLRHRPDRGTSGGSSASCVSSPSTTVKLRAALDPADAAVQRRRLRDVLQRQVVLQRCAVDAAGGLAAAEELEQRLLLRAEDDRAVGQPGGEQRLDAEGVAGAEDGLLLGVPDEEGEHAAQPVDDVLAPQVVAGDDRLGVALGREGRALGGQLRPQLQVVVDLAVEDDPVPAVGVGHRLVAVLDVDEGQPVEAEHRPVVPPRPRSRRGRGGAGSAGPRAPRRPWRRRRGRRRWRSRRAGHTSGAGLSGVEGAGGGAWWSDALAGAGLRVATRSAKKDRKGTVPARTVSTEPLRVHLARSGEVDGGQEEEARRASRAPSRGRVTGSGCPPKYFSGTATHEERDEQDADDGGHHAVALQRRRRWPARSRGPARCGQRPWSRSAVRGPAR